MPFLSTLEEAFVPKGQVLGGSLFLPSGAAIELVHAARMARLPVLGIDAFVAVDATLQPLLDCTADFSAGPSPPADSWSLATHFLAGHSEPGRLFEVVLDGPIEARPNGLLDSIA